VRAIVVGGSGFVGRHVVERLLRDGVDVVTIDRFQPPRPLSGETSIVCDITELESAESLARGLETDALVWLPASIRQSANVDASVHDDVQLMVEAPLRFLRALVSPPGSLVNLSSIQVYGRPRYLPVDEAHPTAPFTVYGVSKLCGEHYLSLAGSARGCSVASLRAAFIYGPGQHEQNVIPRFLSELRQGRAPVVHGDGNGVRDDVHVHDVAAAVSGAIERRAHGVFNVASGRPHTLREVAEIACRVSGAGVTPSFETVENDWVDRWYDVTRARAELGVGPPLDFETALREMWITEVAA